LVSGARIVLDCAGGFIALGGLYDLATPALPANLSAVCGANAPSARLVRELLRALGGSLIAIGIAVVALANVASLRNQGFTPWLVLMLVLPSEGVNAFGMCRAGSPFVIPLAFIAVTVAGAAIALIG